MLERSPKMLFELLESCCIMGTVLHVQLDSGRFYSISWVHVAALPVRRMHCVVI